jgi:hypothetical protein
MNNFEIKSINLKFENIINIKTSHFSNPFIKSDFSDSHRLFYSQYPYGLVFMSSKGYFRCVEINYFAIS